MSYTEALSQWEQTVSRHLPHLSRPQVVVLAVWSYAMIVCKSCGTTSGALWLSDLLEASMMRGGNACGSGATMPRRKKARIAVRWWW